MRRKFKNNLFYSRINPFFSIWTLIFDQVTRSQRLCMYKGRMHCKRDLRACVAQQEREREKERNMYVEGNRTKERPNSLIEIY